jgi:hypothetical protein
MDKPTDIPRLKVRLTPEERSLEGRFWVKVDRWDPDHCWEWTAAKTNGYGVIQAGPPRRGNLLAHRVSYELCIGPIPEGLTIDHLCRNKGCVNPKHLEPVTMAENLRRGNGVAAVNRRKTHCVHGHPFDAENTDWAKDGSRSCRACSQRAARENWAKRKAAR